MRGMTRAIGTLCLLFLTTATFAVQVTEMKVNNWSGGAFTYDDGSNRFSHCVMGTYYNHGTWLYLGLLASGMPAIGFFNEQWSLGAGEEVTGSVQIDDRYLKPFSTKSEANGKIFYLYYPATDPIVESVRRGRVLTLEMNSDTVMFDLSDTSAAYQLVKDCVAENQGKVLTGAVAESANAALNLWLAENPWFQNPEEHREKYEAAMKINEELLRAGWDDSKLSFYAEIDRRLEAEMARKASSRSEKRPLSDFFKNKN